MNRYQLVITGRFLISSTEIKVKQQYQLALNLIPSAASTVHILIILNRTSKVLFLGDKRLRQHRVNTCTILTAQHTTKYCH